MVEVTGLTGQGSLSALVTGAQSLRDGGAFSGSYEVSYATAGDDGPATLRHKISLHRQLTDNYTMQLDGDLINLIGSNSQEMLPATAGIATDYLSLNFSGRGRSFDVIDSYLNASPISFNDYTLRGLHLTESSSSSQHGLDVFAGIARPQTTLFGGGEGRIAGFMMPVANGESWGIRAGMTYVAPRRDDASSTIFQQSEGGTVWQADAQFLPNGLRASSLITQAIRLRCSAW